MFIVLFDGKHPPKYSRGLFNTFAEARGYVNGWLSNLNKSAPANWFGEPFEFIEGSTIEIKDDRAK